MAYCCVPMCESRKDINHLNLPFHKFPSGELYKKWSSVIAEATGSEINEALKIKMVCGRHFKETDYIPNRGRRFLRPEIIPSIFFDANGHEINYQVRQEGSPASSNANRMSVDYSWEGEFLKDIPVDHPNTPTSVLPIQVRQEGSPASSNANRMSVDYSLEGEFLKDIPVDHPNIPTSVSSKVDVGIQCDSLRVEHTAQINALKVRMEKTRIKYKKLTENLEAEIKELRKREQDHLIERQELQEKIKQLEETVTEECQCAKIGKKAGEGDMRGIFLMDQINLFSKEKVSRYHEVTIKLSILMCNKSSAGYEHLRNLNVLHLPCRSTLKNYVGPSTGESGITPLIKARLKAECESLTHENEKVGTVIIDEMKIDAKLKYDRNLDKWLGLVDTDDQAIGLDEKLANSLLSFLYKGLSTHHRIPAAYYFTAAITGDELHKLTLEVIKAVEESGLHTVRIVTDNAQVNALMFRKLSGGAEIKHEIIHPVDPSKKLFLSFDPSHILKNVRNQFMARKMSADGNIITGDHVKLLYKMQSSYAMKPVRGLDKKAVYPNTFEKMNVARAKLIFSDQVTAALQTMNITNPGLIQDKASLTATIKFMDVFRKWFDVHDVCNTTQGIHSRNDDKLVFNKIDDERLEWLVTDFLEYIKCIQENPKSSNRFTDETYEAMVVTSKSTSACIHYLLEMDFHFVLSRNFLSDDIEQFFGQLRYKGGYNDKMDVRSCIYAIRSTLQTGIIATSKHGNVSLRSGEGVTISTKADFLKIKEDKPEFVAPELPPFLKTLLESPVKDAPANLVVATLSLVGGYLVLVAEQTITCSDCLDTISGVKSNSPTNSLIHFQDRGGLRYPTQKFVALLKWAYDFCGSAVHHIQRTNLEVTLQHFLRPQFSKFMTCKCNQKEQFVDLVLGKFIRPLLDNIGSTVTQQLKVSKNLRTKPLSRKVHKV